MTCSLRRSITVSSRLRTFAFAAGVTAGLCVAGWSPEALAGPREDMRSSYGEALRLFNDLEIEQAASKVDEAIAAAEAAGAGEDPTLASLYVMKAALLYSTQGDEAADAITQALTKAVQLNYYVVVPVEVRSEGLTNYLAQAKKYAGAAPSSSIVHEVPDASCGGDIPVEALLGVPDGGQAALYVRRVGATEYQGLSMDVFSNVAAGTISAGVHGDESLEYFIVAFDAQNRPVASFGTKEQPIKLNQGCEPAVPVGGGSGGGEGGGEGEEGVGENGGEEDVIPPKGDVKTTLPRVWINLGVGTGFGVATGSAERTYEQYFPSDGEYRYSADQYACALARWYAGGIDADLPSVDEFYGTNGPASLYGPTTLNGTDISGSLAGVYDRGRCARHHPVSTGLASAPFHIEPEIQVRVSKRVTLGVYSRLQVVTGSKVIRDDPTKQLGEPNRCGPNGDQEVGENGTAWCDEVYVPEPAGSFEDKPPFSWTIGLKFRYYFLKDDHKFRLFAGGFAGYGFSRLRVKMGFANDLNGNSVPDDFEGANGRDGVGNDPSSCYPVFPYRGACENTGVENADNSVANSYADNADSTERIDTVRLGPGHIGALFGFNYQIVKNFGLFGELQVGGWFPDSSSVLFDINVGPAITF